jgi:hypothetical protein
MTQEKEDMEGWSNFIETFEERYNSYCHDCNHPGCAVKDTNSIDDGYVYKVDVLSLNDDDGPIYPRALTETYRCRTLAVALNKGMKLLFRDSDGWFYESMYWHLVTKEEVAQVAQRLGTTDKLNEIYTKMKMMLQCVECAYYDDNDDHYSGRSSRLHVYQESPTLIEEETSDWERGCEY